MPRHTSSARILRSAAVVAIALTTVANAPTEQDRVARVLAETPLIDGHNDWPEKLAEQAKDTRWTMDLSTLDPVVYHTDLNRLRTGLVGGQFWSVWVPATLPGAEQVKRTLEQIELVHGFVDRHPDRFALATTTADIRRAHRQGRIASLIGVEGGGQIDGSLAVLRAYRALGASYLTLTHSRTIDWADSATDEPRNGGLTPFGVEVVHELNRLGMLVDLSHVSEKTMADAITASAAPVIFSHSSARALDDSPRNVSDAMLKRVAVNGGVVMVNYAPGYVSEERRLWEADRNAELARYNAPPYGGLYIGQPERAAAALAVWDAAHPRPVVTLSQVADHVEHIARVAGEDHVGLGSDFDGVPDLPVGLEGVETYPALLAELMRRGWTDAAVAKLAGRNVLRVMESAERVATDLARRPRE